jgi:uncharacterized protein YndB with AHSA1/START domain
MTRQWWGCAYTNQVRSEIDARVGGRIAHHMDFEDGSRMLMAGEITLLDPPARLSFSMKLPWVEEPTQVSILLEDLGAGRTRLTLTQSGLPESSRDSVGKGWTASLSKLRELLESFNV